MPNPSKTQDRVAAFITGIKRVTDVYSKCVWLNPEPEEIWNYRQSIGIVSELMNGRMFPTTLEGLERAMKLLAK